MKTKESFNSVNFLCLLLIFIWAKPFLKAQDIKKIFRDTAEFTGGLGLNKVKHQDNYIVSGIIRNNKAGIICIDSNGNKQWEVQLTMSNPISTMMLGEDDFLYASVYERDTIHTLKIQAIDGNIIWRNKFRAYSLQGLLDYDSSKFIIQYVHDDFNDYHKRFGFVSKANGDLTATFFIGDLNWTAFESAIEIDHHKDIYITNRDSIIKRSGANPDTILWKQKYSNIAIGTIRFLKYRSEDSSIYAFGTQNNSFNRGFIAKMNATHGTFLKFQPIQNRDIRPNNVKRVNQSFYVSWQHIFVGSTFPFSHMSKFDLLSDTMVWDITYRTPGGGLESIVDFDIDDSGFVYTTGYTHADNYGPGKWQNLKIEPIEGTVIENITITENSTSFQESRSNGFGIIKLPSRVLTFGNLEQRDGLGRALNLTALNPNNFNIISQKNFGNYIYPSKTIQIKKHLNGNYLVLKQVGRGLELVLMDTFDTQIWTKSFTGGLLEGYQLEVAPLGDIYFSAMSRKTSFIFPFKSAVVDSIFIFHLDGLGQLKGSVKRRSSLEKTAPLEIIATDSFAILFFHQNDTIYAIKTRNSAQLGFVNTQIRYQTANESEWKNTLDKDASEVLLFGRKFTAPRILILKKQAFICIDTSALPLFNRVEYTEKIDSNRSILLGKNSSLNSLCALFNSKQMNFEWSYAAPSTFQVHKTILDPIKRHVYLIGKTNSNDIRIQKHRLSNGNLLSSYTFSTGSALQETPIDVVFNEFRNRILIVGSVNKNSLNSDVFIMSIDTSLKFPITYTNLNSNVGANKATTVIQVSKNKFIAGGFISKQEKQYGAIFSIKDSVLCAPIFTKDTIINCGALVWNGNELTKSGSYTSWFYSKNGCDSIVELTLTILPKHTIVQIDSACQPIVWRGKTLTLSGNYYETLTSSLGCDSIIQLQLVIDSLNTSITKIGDTLMSNQISGTYQWINCFTNTFVPGANVRLFVPAQNGSYKAIVSNGICSDTTECFSVLLNAIPNVNEKISYQFYPNPFSDFATLSIPFNYKNGVLKIKNVLGEEVSAITLSNQSEIIIYRKLLPSGIYFFTGEFDEKKLVGKFIIHD